GANPIIDIEKSTNGLDADVAPGPSLAVGSTATFTYVVKNFGNVPLSSVVVTDDQPVTISFVGGDSNSNNRLDVTETWTYTGSKTVTVGQYTNQGTMTGRFTDDGVHLQQVTDFDFSNHLGVAIRNDIDIEKTTTGSPNANPIAPNYDNEDAPNGAGVPLLTPGTTATWTYKVTNNGNVPYTVAQVVVTDDAGTPTIPGDDFRPTRNVSTDVGSDGILSPGEMWVYTSTGIVQNVLSPTGSSITLNLAGNTALDGTDGNVRVFSSGSVSVKTKAFSRVKGTNGAWAPAYLGSYSGGLGVTDSSEGNGSSNRHTIDNIGRDNYAIFVFNQNVIVDSAYLGYVVGDSDMKVWIGTISGAYSTLPTLSDSVLASLGFTEMNLGGGSTRLADLNNGNRAGNVLVIAADTTTTTPEDSFKIEKVTVKRGVPGIYANRGTATVPGDTDSDLSHYANPYTKFYVVDSAATDRTYEYNPGGGLVESYGLNSGNSNPRGVATTIAGDRTWVVDANLKVYVYNTSGGLLGSWTAAGLPKGAVVEDITTNGTDVWIVDAKSDKVYKYAGAASLLSGSPKAASSFALNSGNKDPKGIVTDGASLWVVNDSTTDKVFKYSVSGSCLGSWTIGEANAAPTGLTIDPANVSHIWIVDRSTYRVYQYSNAATRTSGSLTAAVTFPLAAGNTSPQGIADPPPQAAATVEQESFSRTSLAVPTTPAVNRMIVPPTVAPGGIVGDLGPGQTKSDAKVFALTTVEQGLQPISAATRDRYFASQGSVGLTSDRGIRPTKSTDEANGWNPDLFFSLWGGDSADQESQVEIKLI
ncbi:MAG: hypothetical protein ABI614_02040, partial [Planctomycetota bacterium]